MRKTTILAGIITVILASAVGLYLLPGGETHGESVGPLTWQIEDGVLVIDPVLEFKNEPSEGILEVEE